MRVVQLAVKWNIRVSVLHDRSEALVRVMLPLRWRPELGFLVLLPIVEAFTTHGIVVKVEEFPVPL